MKVAIITGASRGIGNSTARELARRGIGVIATYRGHQVGADELVAAIHSHGGKARALHLDVIRSDTFADFAGQVTAVLRTSWDRSTFDYLINNAGVGGFSLLTETTEADFDHLMSVHLKGPFFLTQALLPMMADGGQVVNLTSATTRLAFPGCSPYAAMKGGLEVLTRYMAKELGARGIRANSVSPGAIRTEFADNALDKNAELEKTLAAMTALGRIGEPEDVALAIASLLSEDSRWVNGQSIEVSGGMSL